ncbi:4-hydroxybenzoate 3-monooxygenase [Pseudorhodoplanes sp.]|uniref:4-hydroxybenzoate 3-monooxygenase n=1 Tax=Pseudorhodoplanes sp. TaxID=1934341 RepID=UPI003D0C3C0A
MRTQVGIFGAGPAGLMLSHLLHLAGIESIVIENRSREYIEQRIRAGLIEQWATDMLTETGVGERMEREAMFHDGSHLCFDGSTHQVNFRELVGKGITVYGQQEVVKDLVDRRLADGGQILFEVDNTAAHDCHTDKPFITLTHDGKDQRIDCDFIAGCDGFHGICRPTFPEGALTFYDREYPFGWLGILSESPPPDDELIYAYHPTGFALYTMRTPTLARLYLQVDYDEDANNWSDNRIWEQLHVRLGGTRKLQEGKILQKGVTAMRSFVCEPMRSGRLFLAGDSAHIVPPTGAKGMNLALADVKMLSRAIADFYRSRRTDLLDSYSDTCLKRVWKAQRFSWWMTQIFHVFPNEVSFDRRRQLAELDYLAHSTAAQTSLAEQYTGLPFD